MLLSLLTVASATAFGPYPETLFVDASCEPLAAAEAGQELRILHRARSQSCAPGGPCSLIQDDPADAGEAWLLLDGCRQPLEGRFEVTGASCEGLEVWRWSEPLPAGAGVSVTGPGGSSGWLRLSGEGICPVEEEAVLLSRLERDEPERVFFPVLGPEELQVHPVEGEAYELRWSLSPEFTTWLPEEARTFRADWPHPSAELGEDELKGRVSVQAHSSYQVLRRFRLHSCRIELETVATLTLEGHTPELVGRASQTWETPGACPIPMAD